MYIGEDLDVLLELSDRIMVLCHGRITGIVDAAKTTKEEIGMMMTGGDRRGNHSGENQAYQEEKEAGI